MKVLHRTAVVCLGALGFVAALLYYIGESMFLAAEEAIDYIREEW